jgi:hypothetical protein
MSFPLLSSVIVVLARRIKAGGSQDTDDGSGCRRKLAARHTPRPSPAPANRPENFAAAENARLRIPISDEHRREIQVQTGQSKASLIRFSVA